MSVFSINTILFCGFKGHVSSMNNNAVSFSAQGDVEPKILRLMMAEMVDDLVQYLLGENEIDDMVLMVSGVSELFVRTYVFFDTARMEMFGGDTLATREYFFANEQGVTRPSCGLSHLGGWRAAVT